MCETEEQRVATFFGITSEDQEFLDACTHPTYAHENPGSSDNQRLEFLGDAILDLFVSRDLYRRFTDYDEGALTQTRAQIVSTEALAAFCRSHSLATALRTGKGSREQLLASDNVLADLVEALIAASYYLGAEARTEEICQEIISLGLFRQEQASFQDPKSSLQEVVQAEGLPAPVYAVVSRSGPAHRTSFRVEVILLEQSIGIGEGRSKKLAERAAAEDALSGQKYLLLRQSQEVT